MLGAGGQFAINKWNSTDVPSAEKQTSWRFNPMKKLTDQEYENILDEKLLVLETEIALLDDNLAELRSQKKEQENAASNQPTSASLTKPRSWSSMGTGSGTIHQHHQYHQHRWDQNQERPYAMNIIAATVTRDSKGAIV